MCHSFRSYTMNVTFAKSADAFIQAEKKEGNAFTSLVEYAVSVMTDVLAKDAADALKNKFAAEEDGYKVAKKIDAMPTAYRSSKSVIMSAVKLGVPLVDADGKALGKTAIEKATKEAKGDDGKTELAKFTSTMSTAMSIFTKMDTLHDVQAAYKLVEELANAVVKANAELVSKAAASK
jgi:hypothetical protein